MSGSTITVIAVIALMIGILLLCRSIVIWWTGINEVIKGIDKMCENQRVQIKQMDEVIKINK